MDNFDQNIETKTGHGIIHTTHGEVFQDSSSSAVYNDEKTCIPRSKRRALAPQQIENRLQQKIIPHKEPILPQKEVALFTQRETFPAKISTCCGR